MQNNRDKLAYLKNQENNIELILRAVFQSVNTKRYKYAIEHRITKESDLPEVYQEWIQRYNTWKEEFRPKLYEEYVSPSQGQKHNFYLMGLFMGLNQGNFQDKDDPLFQELSGIKLEGELCIPDIDEV